MINQTKPRRRIFSKSHVGFAPAVLWPNEYIRKTASKTPELIRQWIDDETALAAMGVQYPPLVRAFYKSNQYRTAWLDDTAAINRTILLRDLNAAGNLGLEKTDYHYKTMQAIQGHKLLANATDSTTTEVLLTDAAIHLYSDVQNGCKAPELSYDGLKYKPDAAVIIGQIAFCAAYWATLPFFFLKQNLI